MKTNLTDIQKMEVVTNLMNKVKNNVVTYKEFSPRLFEQQLMILVDLDKEFDGGIPCGTFNYKADYGYDNFEVRLYPRNYVNDPTSTEICTLKGPAVISRFHSVADFKEWAEVPNAPVVKPDQKVLVLVVSESLNMAVGFRAHFGKYRQFCTSPMDIILERAE